MKKIIPVLFVLLLIPGFSHAATLTPEQRNAIVAEIQVLESELQAILAQQAPATPISTVPAKPEISIQALSRSTTSANGVLDFSIAFSITTDDTTIDIPQNSVGVQYILNGLQNVPSTLVMSCPAEATYDGTSYCEIPPNTTETLGVVSSVPASAIVWGNPVPQMQIEQIKYYTNVNTNSQSFSYYQPTGLVSGSYISYPK